MASSALDIQAPLPNHVDIVRYSSLFWVTFAKFHSDLGSKILIPVARKYIDLHLLYVEVTKKGGYAKVVLGRKWKEVAAPLMLPPNASHGLKEYYFETLYKYEQVYYFGYPYPQTKPSPYPLTKPGTSFTGTIDAEFEGGYSISAKVGSEVLAGILVYDEKHTPPATTSTTVAPTSINCNVPKN